MVVVVVMSGWGMALVMTDAASGVTGGSVIDGGWVILIVLLPVAHSSLMTGNNKDINN